MYGEGLEIYEFPLVAKMQRGVRGGQDHSDIFYVLLTLHFQLYKPAANAIGMRKGEFPVFCDHVG